MADLGRAALLITLGLCLYACVIGTLAAITRRRRLAMSARNALIASFGSTMVATAILVTGFVRNSIVIETLGEKDGRRFMPLIFTIFFLTLGLNLTGTIPGLQIASTGLIGMPIIMAVVAYVVFVYAGLRRHGFRYFKNQLILPGVPIFLVPFLALLEFLSTFILRPVTPFIRLLMNMVAGHMLLVLCFSATQFFFFSTDLPFTLFGVGTLAFGFIFTLFELLVAVLQAYVFTYLTAVYIQLALAEAH